VLSVPSLHWCGESTAENTKAAATRALVALRIENRAEVDGVLAFGAAMDYSTDVMRRIGLDAPYI
jgi:hypothetical protein